MESESRGRRVNRAFAWGQRQQKGFDDLRRVMTAEPVVMLPDLHCDQRTLRAWRSAGDSEGRPRAVAYYSRKTTEVERRMDIRTLELLLAVVSALDKMHM